MLQKVVYGKTGGKAMGLSAQMNIFLCDSLIQDYDKQLLDISRTNNLTSKQISAEIDDIKFAYNQEERLVKNDMEGVDKTSDDYKEILTHLQELEEEEDMKISRLQSELKDKDSAAQAEQSTIEVSRNYAQKTRDSLQEALDAHIERSGYFTQ